MDESVWQWFCRTDDCYIPVIYLAYLLQIYVGDGNEILR